MSAENEIEALVAHARKTLWLALVLVLVLGACGLAMIFGSGAGAPVPARTLMLTMPVCVAFAAVAGSGPARTSRAMTVLLQDELRQFALQRALRNGFLAVLAIQPVLAWTLSTFAVAAPLALMAALTCMLGLCTVIASVLYYDR